MLSRKPVHCVIAAVDGDDQAGVAFAVLGVDDPGGWLESTCVALSPSLFFTAFDEVLARRQRALARRPEQRPARAPTRNAKPSCFTTLAPIYPLDRGGLAEQGSTSNERRARHFGKSRSRRSIAASGRRCATAAAVAAFTSSRMRKRASSIRPTSPASCSTGATAAASITRTARSWSSDCVKLDRKNLEQPRLAAEHLRVSAAGRGRAAARVALSHLRQPRDGA